MPGSSRLVFLGGLGEVGRNMACLELEDRLLIIDAGLSFPTEDMPGVDLVLPDFAYLVERKERIEGVVLTHGHEDHLGALPYMLREMKLQVFATALTLGLLRPKLEEHRVLDRAGLHEVVPGEELRKGPFTMRFHRVTHSIPDGIAVAIDTPWGPILHTGDFKLDPTPIDGRATDLEGFAEEAERGVHLLLSDSTNSEDAGTVPSERTIGPSLLEIFREVRGLVVTACFSSHIHRIQQLCDAAAGVGRKVAFLGRSMHQAVAQARTLGYLLIEDDRIVDIEEVQYLSRSEVVVVSTGSQGEPLSALSLMAAREHKWVDLQPGDAVVISASVIPGNETAINRVVDGLYRTEADVFHTGNALVHVSGHGAQDELKHVLELVRPRWFIPVHGERRHLANHARIAREAGVPPDRILICEDGDVVEVGETIRLTKRIQAGMVLVDGLGIGDVGEIVLRDRRRLAGDGFVVAVVTVDAKTAEVLAGPDLITRGFVHDETSAEMLVEAEHRVLVSLKELADHEVADPAMLREHIRTTLGRYFREAIQRKPLIVPVIMEV